jgi:hypothetical protein
MGRYDHLTKTELAVLRVELIAKLDAAVSVGSREEVQADLGLVNARIKQLNVDAAWQAKATADAKKARGMAEQQANLARAAGHSMSPLGAVAQEESRLSHVEVVLRAAKQLGQMLDTHEQLPYTRSFRLHLTAFIKCQEARVVVSGGGIPSEAPSGNLVAAYLAPIIAKSLVAPKGGEEWTKTWTEEEPIQTGPQPGVSYQTMTCGRCSGTGQISGSDGWGGYSREVCSQCNGKRVVEISALPIAQVQER